LKNGSTGRMLDNYSTFRCRVQAFEPAEFTTDKKPSQLRGLFMRLTRDLSEDPVKETLPACPGSKARAPVAGELTD